MWPLLEKREWTEFKESFGKIRKETDARWCRAACLYKTTLCQGHHTPADSVSILTSTGVTHFLFHLLTLRINISYNLDFRKIYITKMRTWDLTRFMFRRKSFRFPSRDINAWHLTSRWTCHVGLLTQTKQAELQTWTWVRFRSVNPTLYIESTLRARTLMCHSETCRTCVFAYEDKEQSLIKLQQSDILKLKVLYK